MVNRTDTEDKALGIVILSRLLARISYNDILYYSIENEMFSLEERIEDKHQSVFAVNLFWRNRYNNLLDYFD